MIINTKDFINPNHNVEYLYVFTTSYEVLIIAYDYNDEKMYKVVCDKDLKVQYFTIIEIKDTCISNFDLIRFFKPGKVKRNTRVFSGLDDYSFSGIIRFDDKIFKFKIEDDVFTILQPYKIVHHLENSLISCINGININCFMQKGNFLYLSGSDYENFTIFGIVNIEKDLFVKLYYLTSDIGDIFINSLNVDLEDGKIYLTGSMVNGSEIIPYLEIFTI